MAVTSFPKNLITMLFNRVQIQPKQRFTQTEVDHFLKGYFRCQEKFSHVKPIIIIFFISTAIINAILIITAAFTSSIFNLIITRTSTITIPTTINHIIRKYNKPASKECRIIYRKLCKRFGFKYAFKQYQHKIRKYFSISTCNPTIQSKQEERI